MGDAIYCENGHYIGRFPEPLSFGARVYRERAFEKELNPLKFCAKCGKPTLGVCLSCDASLRLDGERPSYCGSCGKPFPWTQVALDAANEYTDELEGVSEEDKTGLKATFSKLTVETAETPLAESRFKKYLAKIGPPAASALTRILGDVMTSEIKRRLGLG